MSLNPAVDITYRVRALVVGDAQRVREVESVAGGKAVNVARVLASLAHPVTLLGLAGGPDGAVLRDGLAAAGVATDLVPIAAATRRTVTVVDDTGRATGLWEPGPPVTGDEWSLLQRHLTRQVGDHAVVVCSGSLPAGVPADAYATLTDVAHRAGCAVIVDADGEALRQALAAGPDVIKPNREELARARPVAPDPAGPTGAGLTGAGPTGAGLTGALRWDREIVAAGHLRREGAGAVVVSAGPDGLVAVTGEGSWAAAPPEVVVGNPTGAGDATVAAVARGLAAGNPWPEILADALALAAAAVVSPVGGAFSEGHYATWRPGVRVERIERAPCPS